MKLITYKDVQDKLALGAIRRDQAIPLEPFLLQIGQQARNMVELLEGFEKYPSLRDQLKEYLDNDSKGIPLASVHIQAPILRPRKIVALGRNYADHAKETSVQPFEKPRIISKFSSSITGTNTKIHPPETVKKLDFEIELALVIGKTAKNISRENAQDYIAGYTILNDISAREFQFDITPPQTTFAKSMDGFCPLGPYLLTADELQNPQDLELNLWLNDNLMQHGNTKDMLFPVDYQIEYISSFTTLEPGDIIATGTPAGIGAFRNPPVWLKSGDELKLSITHLGTLINRIA
jgi:2-keto-4-pentenoate hydratase/2-oxohepta-3-ene-1,7-dioic acid hydratase in catechol pathway